MLEPYPKKKKKGGKKRFHKLSQLLLDILWQAKVDTVDFKCSVLVHDHEDYYLGKNVYVWGFCAACPTHQWLICTEWVLIAVELLFAVRPLW